MFGPLQRRQRHAGVRGRPGTTYHRRNFFSRRAAAVPRDRWLHRDLREGEHRGLERRQAVVLHRRHRGRRLRPGLPERHLAA
jgi:hypothetical protein